MLDATGVVLVGGGLSNCLNATFLSQKHPSTAFHIFEVNSSVFPAKTWSFHVSDIAGYEEQILPLASHKWDSYDVFFPSFQRTLNMPYATIKPESLIKATSDLPQVSFHYNQNVSAEEFKNDCVLDSSGALQNSKNGYQKFLGLQVKLKSKHGLKRPILMDARLPQTDGYRFMYVLPWSDSELLIEETHYSDIPEIPYALYETEILKYIQNANWELLEIQSKESGSLPIPLDLPEVSSSSIKVGVHGQFFHPVTGYSLPYAVRTAKALSDLKELNSHNIAKCLHELRKQQASQQRFFLLLNRLMFQSAKPEQRYKIFEHFYSLSDEFIKRFYRGEMNFSDRIRIFLGKPPVPVRSALPVFLSMRSL